MRIRNFEFKARVDDINVYENKLLKLNPFFKGADHQVDTYFNAPKGRLKLREGNIENALISYERKNVSGSKLSQVILYQYTPDEALKNILEFQLGIKTIVDKKRKIYFIKNVKFHFDEVKKLGSFIEVEATDNENLFTTDELKEQCDHYFLFFNLNESSLVDASYSDLLMKNIHD